MNSEAQAIETELANLRHRESPDLLGAVQLGTGVVDGYAIFESPIGDVMVAFNPDGVSAVDLADETFEDRFSQRFHRSLAPASPPSAWGSKITRAIEEGRLGSVPVDFRSVTTFQRSILEIAATIPRGEVRPYSWLARRAGNPGAARAVGSTMARNPVPLIIPCHRVVRTDGTIGKYSLGGAENKWQLLNVEGATPEYLEGLAADGVRFVGSDSTGIFCYPTCHQARRITQGHLQLFGSTDDAAGRGFRPCRVCQPA